LCCLRTIHNPKAKGSNPLYDPVLRCVTVNVLHFCNTKVKNIKVRYFTLWRGYWVIQRVWYIQPAYLASFFIFFHDEFGSDEVCVDGPIEGVTSGSWCLDLTYPLPQAAPMYHSPTMFLWLSNDSVQSYLSSSVKRWTTLVNLWRGTGSDVGQNNNYILGVYH